MDKINGLRGEKMDQKLLEDKVFACSKLGGAKALCTNDKIDEISLYSERNCLYRLFQEL